MSMQANLKIGSPVSPQPFQINGNGRYMLASTSTLQVEASELAQAEQKFCERIAAQEPLPDLWTVEWSESQGCVHTAPLMRTLETNALANPKSDWLIVGVFRDAETAMWYGILVQQHFGSCREQRRAARG